MKLQKSTKIILATAGILLIAVIAVPKKKKADAMPTANFAQGTFPAPSPAANTVATLANDEQLLAQSERSEELSWERDPFAPIGTQPLDTANYRDDTTDHASRTPRFSGVSTVGDVTFFLIDGELVQAGDRLSSGHTVETIDKRTVALSKGRERETLFLGGDQ
jgi:hypothetical protein